MGVTMAMEVSFFYWYAKLEDFDELGNLDIDISGGRSRHRWVPTSKQDAVLFLKNHEDAEGLRKASESYVLVSVTLAEPIPDLSGDYPDSVVTGLSGAIIRTPFKYTLPKKPTNRQLARGIELPSVSYKQSSVIETYEPKQFSSLQMGLLTENEIREMSAVEVIAAGAFQDNEAFEDQTPIKNGVHDLKMGTLDQDIPCETCGLRYDEQAGANGCLGHFGHINLTVPVPKLQYLGISGYEAPTTYPILFTLNTVCHNCSRIMLPQGPLDALKDRIMSVFENNKRNHDGHVTVRNKTLGLFKTYHKSERLSCPHCQSYSPEFRFNHGTAEFYTKEPDQRYENGARMIDYEIVHEIFKKIKDEDVFYLGLDPTIARPEDMFFSLMPVAPNIARPPRTLPGKKIKELDDLTKLYQDVVQANENLFDIRLKAGNPRAATKFLYLSVSRVYDNRNKKIGSGGTSQERGYGGSVRNVSFKGIKNRLEGKRGRFRNNLQSKYVEQVGYSTITPNADLSIDEVGVPRKMAMKATVGELVTKENIDRLREMCLRGPHEYPGATHIILDGNKLNKSKDNTKATWEQTYGVITLERLNRYLKEGAMVMRHIIDGDIGLFNRAPSLHRQSVLGMRAKILESNSLAMNPTICIPFNADYDGDAMKLHFVQSEEAKADARKWLMLDRNIIHARYGKLTVATDQDQTSGLYLLTHTDKRRKNEWNPSTGLGFTDEGVPYFDKRLAVQAYKYVYSEIRDEDTLKDKYKQYKKATKEKPEPYEEWVVHNKYRRIESLPTPDYKTPNGDPAYTGRAIFSHLFTVLDAEYVSATFKGNTPAVDEEGNILREQKGPLLLDPSQNKTKKIKERIILYKGKLLQGTLEKDSFGEGGSSLAPPFIYHEGYDKGITKLNEFIEMATRLGYAGHHVVGYTMGLTDVNIYGEKATGTLNALYDQYSQKITEVTQSYFDKDYMKFAETDSEKIVAITSPGDFIEEKIVDLAGEYEDRILEPIEDEQGSGNPMQIAVRSKARGKDQNVRQMGGSFGIVLVGGKRIVHGVEPYRALAHFPKGDNHPKYTGFVKSGYAKGMEPTEYWQTSSAGRRSAVESGQGNISKSGYLERKMIKALEPLVVNDKKQVVNVRTGRIISPLVGDDGLAPYHIRGSHEDTNSNGLIITTQPLLLEYECKHGMPLESVHTENYPAHKCNKCSKDSDFSKFEDELSKLDGFLVPITTQNHIKRKIQGREVDAATLRKMAKSLHAFYQESICRTGEAIGATAGGCLGEPATQAALRTFHFAGKMSFQGSVDRLKQMLETPNAQANLYNARTEFNLKPEFDTPDVAKKIASVCRKITMNKIVDYIGIDPNQMRLKVMFKTENLAPLMLGKSQAVVLGQIRNALEKKGAGIGPYEIQTENFQFTNGISIKLLSNQKESLLRAKESIMSAVVSGITNAELVIVTKDNGLDIRDSDSSSLNNIVNQLSDYIDFSTFKTNNLDWIYKNYGLEAMLNQFCNELSVQMNGENFGGGGVGEYDVRYIRTIADLMGEEGVPKGLGPHGLGSKSNYSFLSAASLENVPDAMRGSSLMGNKDNLKGPAEAIVSGSTPAIGDFSPTYD
jgi:DNA-directed RNA polymerase subunit A'